jgi:hypothetical protein
MRGSDAGVDALLFIRAVAGERGDGTINLIKQGTDLRTVVNIVGSQRRRNDLASLGINSDVQFTPRPAPARTLLLDQPLAGTGQLQSSTVHQQMHRFGVGRRSRHLQRLCPPADCGMVRDGKIRTEQAENRADQSFA